MLFISKYANSKDRSMMFCEIFCLKAQKSSSGAILMLKAKKTRASITALKNSSSISSKTNHSKRCKSICLQHLKAIFNSFRLCNMASISRQLTLQIVERTLLRTVLVNQILTN